MTPGLQVISRVYGLLLGLYPRGYREEYGEELQMVFHLSLSDAARTGGWEVARIVLHELVSLPQAVLVQHLRERRRAHMVKNFGTYFNFAPGSWREFLSALCPFLLFALISPVIDLLGRVGLLVPGGMVADGIGIAFLVVMAILFLAGIFSGLPRWFFPYIGFLLSIVSVSVFSILVEKWHGIPFQELRSQSWLLEEVIYQGFLWIGLTPVAMLLALLSLFLPAFSRFKKDWTLLAFLLYGAIPFALMLAFDDYFNDGVSKLFASLILAAGAWFYLHINNPRRQFWSLFGGMTFCLLFAAVAKAIIYQYSWEGLRYFTWRTEMMSTVYMWGWLALTMLIPLAFQRLARSKEALPAIQD